MSLFNQPICDFCRGIILDQPVKIEDSDGNTAEVCESCALEHDPDYEKWANELELQHWAEHQRSEETA